MTLLGPAFQFISWFWLTIFVISSHDMFDQSTFYLIETYFIHTTFIRPGKGRGSGKVGGEQKQAGTLTLHQIDRKID